MIYKIKISMKIINTISLVAAIGVAASLAMIMPAFAQTAQSMQGRGAWTATGRDGMRGGMAPGVFGTVSAVNGNILTVTASMRPERPMPEQALANSSTSTVVAGIVYTVDATNAKIYKGSATTTVSVSAIAPGDNVIVQGAVSGTNVTAIVIRDNAGGPMGDRSGMPGRGLGRDASLTPIINGNGEPVVGGSITAISGTTLTVTNTSGVTYTISAASSTFVVKGARSMLSSVAVGDNVIVQGTVNGNSVTASSIIDQGKAANISSNSGHPQGVGIGADFGGFFGAIGGFFRHLFGF
jgi:hypothetical protein